ncbi:MAG: gas vesicle protein GvpG [Vulcanimicrobiota bacterium]
MAFLIDDLIFSPLTLVKWIGEKLLDAAEQELTDDSEVQAALLDLQMRYELEEMSDDEFQQKEALLLKKLEAINTFKEKGI